MIATAPATPHNALLLAGMSSRRDLLALLTTIGYQPTTIENAEGVQSLDDQAQLCVIDLRQGTEALRVARAVRSSHAQAVIIGVADPERPTASADAIRAGVFDVMPHPASARDLEALLANAREQMALARRQETPQRSPLSAPYGIVGTSSAMRPVMELVERAAAGRCGIMICGERGTGREMLARAIHARGQSAGAPFVKVDCAAPDDIELMLFGSVPRRATGPTTRATLERIGERSLLREAHGGILFLENVAELPARAQARLVRVLRDREVYVDDEREPMTLDIRPIAAVDGSVSIALEEGRLRTDLHERLSLIRVDVPPLRQRREDVPVLATHFLKEICRANRVPIKTLTRSALTLLAALPWRGNAPELRSLLERLILLVPQGLIRLEDVLAQTQLEGALSPSGTDATLRAARERFEREYIGAVLQHQHGRISDAARVLGIQRTNLYRKMRRLNLIHGKAGRKA